MDLLLATQNKHKTQEFSEILGQDFRMVDLSAVPDIGAADETGSTFEQNATLKALAVAQQRSSAHTSASELPRLVIADDSGLEVDALGGAPGIYSARYAGEGATDAENVEKLLLALRGKTERGARFRCVIALVDSAGLIGTFHGAAEGKIVESPRGTGGFGYDPVFQPAGFDRTFAELPSSTKNQVSHRARAIRLLRQALETGIGS